MTSAPPPQALPDAPTDGITRLLYLKDHVLASCSWDGSIRIHDTTKMTLQAKQTTGVPLLGMTAVVGNQQIAVGCMDGVVKLWDIERNQVRKLMSGHDQAVKSVVQLDKHTLASAGWDANVCIWDLRSNSVVNTLTLPGKAFDMDAREGTFGVVTSGRRTVFGNAQGILSNDESSLKYQLRCIRFFPDAWIAACGSVEGRVAVESCPAAVGPSQKTKFAFKCHRSNDMVYPVNDICFYKGSVFCTAGCDGTVGTFCMDVIVAWCCSLLTLHCYSPLEWRFEEKAHVLSRLADFSFQCRPVHRPNCHGVVLYL